MLLLLVEIDDGVVDLNDLVDVLIADEQKFDVLEVLLIDLQLLVDQVVELKQGPLLINQLLVV